MRNMGSCRLRQINNNGEIETFTCDEIREKHLDMKAEFRKLNRTDEVLAAGRMDAHYKQFCESIDNFLYQCKCVPEISLKCERCDETDHEGYFCRCENRNIALAKQLRKDNKAEGESHRKRSKREDITTIPEIPKEIVAYYRYLLLGI